MITIDTIFSILRKSKKWCFGINTIFPNDWPGLIYLTLKRLEDLKTTSLMGLDNDCLSIVPFKEVLDSRNKPELSYFVWLRPFGKPPIVFSLSKDQEPTIFHIGQGLDREDLNFKKYRPGYKLPIPLEDLDEKNFFPKYGAKSSPIFPGYIIRIDCRPKDTGGPGHYFFYKVPRDLRLTGNSVFKEVVE